VVCHKVLGEVCPALEIFGLTQTCEDGWFGPECRYKCHCQHSCNHDGKCPDKCDLGWFGYKCQYRTTEYKAVADNGDLTFTLNDDDDATCINIKTEALVLHLLYSIPIPWIRMFTLKPVAKKYIKHIILEGEAIRQLCSLWIISGQNVAIKQNVYYSNVNTNLFDTQLQHYPQATDGLYDCNISDTGIAGTNWVLVLNPSFFTKTYYFFVNDTFGGYRNTTIKSYNNSGQMTDTFNFVNLTSSTSYGFGHESLEPTTAIAFSMTSSTTNNIVTFLLCEVETFTECREGTWGVQCQNKCNENCPDSCRFDDGLCSNGCFGYSDPPRCTNECEPGTWGLNCTKRCNHQCFNSSCDKITGVCDKVCYGFSNPPHCTTGCNFGKWGFNCNEICPKECFNLSCDGISGMCTQGCLGYSDPPKCISACTAGLYGINCASKCSDQCLNQTCDAITGHCIHCREGFQGLFCEQVIKKSDGFSEQTIISIAASLATAALIALVIFLIALKATGKLCFERKENMHSLPEPSVIPECEVPYDYIEKPDDEIYNKIDEIEIQIYSNAYALPVMYSQDGLDNYLNTNENRNESQYEKPISPF
ncbi:multiple epidermal growth factor-like domains protein 6, partial [Biomphalaria pfeifferi]